MKRRTFIALMGGAAASPLVAQAQQPAKMKRIAMVSPSEPVANMFPGRHPFWKAFFDGLDRAGFVEGNNLVVERYSAGGQLDHFAQLAGNVVDTRPDAIWAIDPDLGLAFKTATTKIPIVATSVDPVATGLVSNIARPGGNVTGTSVDAGLEIWGKRIGLLKEVIPKLSNIAFFVQTLKGWEGPYGSAVRQAAQVAGTTVNAVLMDGKIDEAEYQRVFAAFEKDRPDALMVPGSGVHFTNLATIVGLAAKHLLPAMYTYKQFVEAGGLMSYALDPVEVGRSCGYQMGLILTGTNPGDIPFNQVSRFDLAINLKTARSLGLEFPATLLGSAGLVVE
jgi:putative ABC transport system substrate-binding protein